MSCERSLDSDADTSRRPTNAGRSQDLDNLAAYVSSLRPRGESPYRNLADQSLSPSAVAGKVIFESDETGCWFCHPEPTFTDRIRHDVGISTMAVGNISSWMDVNTILAAGRADLCLLARAHLFDPYWTRHAAHMQDYPLQWPDQYESVQWYTPRFEFHFGGET